MDSKNSITFQFIILFLLISFLISFHRFQLTIIFDLFDFMKYIFFMPLNTPHTLPPVPTNRHYHQLDIKRIIWINSCQNWRLKDGKGGYKFFSYSLILCSSFLCHKFGININKNTKIHHFLFDLYSWQKRDTSLV